MGAKFGWMLLSLMGAACFYSPTGVDTRSDETAASSTSTGDVPTTGGSTTSVDVPTEATTGTGSAEATTEPGVCGDGVFGPGEQCDDGNLIDDDVCTNDCRLPNCGDGSIGPGEVCDDGLANAETGACLPGCVPAQCGDGFVQAGVEQCDDGNLDGGDGCSAVCVYEGCGNGIPDPGEACDDGNGNDADACTNGCALAFCGDGIAADPLSSGEQCDDGNQDDSDACLTNCTLATCGDGIVHADVEYCDLGKFESAVCVGCQRAAYYMFVSSTHHTPGLEAADLQGLEHADAICSELAGKLIKGNYKAWLSDTTTAAADRLFHSSLPYVLPGGAVVANDWDDLTDGSIGPVNRTESGPLVNTAVDCDDPMAGAAAVWTNTGIEGGIFGADSCSDWTVGSADAMAMTGLVSKVDSQWTLGCTLPCNSAARLYCIEQP